MGTIEINEKEIAYLRQATINAIVERCNMDRGGIRLNSNPSNYEELVEDIKNKLALKKVKISFFKNLFSSKLNVLVVQVAKIDILYRYLFNEIREEYLKKNKLSFYHKAYHAYHVDISDECQKSLKAKYSNCSIDTLHSEAANVIPALSRFSNDEIIIHINEALLKDPNGIFLLSELFINRFLFLIVDYDISFDIAHEVSDPQSPDKHLSFIEGQEHYWNYWEERKEWYKGFEHIHYEKVFLKDTFVHMLEAISNYEEIKTEQRLHKKSIDSYLPSLARFTRGEVKPLSYIYRQQEEKSLAASTLNYFCVINYHSYFEAKERKEMIKYFHNFAKTLRDQNVFRIFTVPAQRVKNLGWKSLLSPSENQLLYQYLLLNARMEGVHTYIQYYDKSQLKDKTTIIWNQDYVLRVEDDNVTRLNSIKNLSDYYSVHDPRFSEDDKSKLFFAFPENGAYENEVLCLTNELYMRRMHDDFVKRCSYLGKDSAVSRLDEISIQDVNYKEFSDKEHYQYDIDDQCKRSLGLLSLSPNQLHDLRAVVFDHIELGKAVDRLIDGDSYKV